MKKLIIFSLLLTGCATLEQERNTFKSIIQDCDTTSVNSQYGDCVKNGLDEKIPRWTNDKDAQYINAYIQWRNAAGSRVEKGEMTKDDAISGAKELMNRLTTQAHIDEQQRQDSGMAAFFAGLAVMSLAQPTYRYSPTPNTTTYTYPGMRPISCTNIGNVVSCI